MRRLRSLTASFVVLLGIIAGPAQAEGSMRVRATSGPCAGFFVAAVIDGRQLCTHGSDPAPSFAQRGRRVPSPAFGIQSATAQTSSIPCFGDGVDGNRFHAIYAVASDETDNYASMAPTIRSTIDVIDGIFMNSAARGGGDDRHVRFVTDSSCEPLVTKVTLSPSGDDTFEALISELDYLGYNDVGRKYVVWLDANAPFCGVGTVLESDTPSASNPNNGSYPSYAAVSNWCWGGTTESVEAHEVMHTLGAVLPASPYSTDAGHCTDEKDRMCYDDGFLKDGTAMTQPCATEGDEDLFDCGNDDYFAPGASTGWLASHWNTANSSFIEWVPQPTTIVASIAPPTSPSGPIVASFNGPVKNITTSAFQVTSSGSSLDGSLACKTKTGSAVSCLLGPVTKALFTPTSALLTGRTYGVSVSPAESEVLGWLNGETIAPATASARIASQEQTSDAVTYGWPAYSTSSAYGGSYRASRVKYASASYSFSGTSIRWYTIVGPDQGIARAYIDGVLYGTANLYASSKYYKVSMPPIGPLPAGPHTLKIVVYSTGKYVSIDAFKVGSGSIVTNPTMKYRWGNVTHTAPSGDSYSYEDKKGATSTFKFYGTGIEWYTVFGPNHGKATITLNGTTYTFDNYSSSTRYNVKRRISGLPAGTYTVKITVLGTKRSASSGTRIALDRWVALP